MSRDQKSFNVVNSAISIHDAVFGLSDVRVVPIVCVISIITHLAANLGHSPDG
jgi:hypothetical protein